MPASSKKRLETFATEHAAGAGDIVPVVCVVFIDSIYGVLYTVYCIVYTSTWYIYKIYNTTLMSVTHKVGGRYQ